ncbi:hypothetical protein QAD02_013200 [Eretmocerus hayati]|uniref:Uncharacterized protein n=1 Tax=Eretmocerus hayati TaxID=131215 RepID=A0ACC2P2S1_9HYME|nr:hypothetical protein QAD02_013200 [Eretmocerus hayati]
MSPEEECSQVDESSIVIGPILDQAHYPLSASPSTGAEPTAQDPTPMITPTVDTTIDSSETLSNNMSAQFENHPPNPAARIGVDVERFDGKIVYNPDGSAYIIEGESELSEDDSLPEGCIVDGHGMSVPQTQEFPQIANAYYVSKLHYHRGYPYCNHNKLDIPASAGFPIMHSYRVSTYRNRGEESPSERAGSESLVAATSVPVKPILMCFICKLSFGHVKSFTMHAGNEHELSLLESENRVLSEPTTSAIIQVVGKNKQPIIGILEPVLQPMGSEYSERIRSFPSNLGESDHGKEFSNEKNDGEQLESITNNADKPCSGTNDKLLTVQGFVEKKVSGKLDQQQMRWLNSQIGCNSSSPSSSMKSFFAPSASVLHHPTNFLSGTTIGVCPEHLQGRPSGIECTKCEGILNNTRLPSSGGLSAGIHSRNSCKTLKCPKCNWHYKYQETLEIHMKEKHPDAEISCIYCISGQPHPRLARGETYTCGYKPYRCEVCNYSTTTKGNLSIHMQSDKHLNNMQELQQGSGSSNPNDMASLQNTSIHNQTSHSGRSPSVNSQLMNQGKSKPIFRCDACNYETNVARNLRIHMTSEKHTHHMMILQQSMKHMRALSVLQSHQQEAPQNQIQRNQQIDQFIHLGSFDKPHQAEVTLADMAYSQALMISMISGGQIPLGLTPDGAATADPNNFASILPDIDMQSESMEPPPGTPDLDPYYVYQCCICNNFSTDSIESLGVHLALDRTKILERELLTTISGHFVCKLCSYKTNLKANFQLHCKTDKHLQRLQHVNHVKEGGPSNEWKLKYLASPSSAAQIRCHVCDYYTNSIHKLALHAATPKHEAASLLFRHLCESSANISSGSKIYHCSLCGFSAKKRRPLLQHVRSYKHIQMEQLHQLQKKVVSRGNETPHTDIAEIFQVMQDPNERIDSRPRLQTGDSRGYPLSNGEYCSVTFCL